MKKLLLLFLLITNYTLAYTQVIRGSVFDKKTNSPVMYATVYFNGTFVGTVTDEKGEFKLDNIKDNSMPLTVSAMGYYSFTLPDYSTEEALTIYLIPKIFDLKEVVILDKSLVKKRKANLKLFKEVFFGITPNSSECEIENEGDIQFNYKADNDSLIAYTLKPIMINNNALGYKISYYLDNFAYCKKDRVFFYKGSIIFKEDLMNNKKLSGNFERKRKDAYLGSRMHFFRSLWADNLAETGFTVKDSLNNHLTYKDLVVQDIYHHKSLKYMTNIKISYNNSQLSELVLLKHMIFFYKNGYFDSSGTFWKGKMADQRIADFLPYEYQLSEANTN